MSVRPLFKTSLPPGRPIKGHCGLWYDKFLAWDIHRGGVTREATHKHEWVASATIPCGGCSRVGDASLLEEHIERKLRLFLSLDGLAICVKTAGRFVTGLGYEHPVENGFAWHPALGTPYLPGSGLKGVARTWATLMAATEAERGRIDRIFGPRGDGQAHAEGTVVFVEAIPVKPVQLVAEVMTPHYGPYYQSAGVDVAPGDYHDPIPIPFLAVEKGTPFLAGILPRRRDDAGDAKQAHAWLVEALQEIGAGAKTATGYGRFVLDEESEKAWKANAARERLRTGGPLERMRHLVGQMTEGQLYQRAVQVLEKGEELPDPAEREAFRLAARESRFFASWRRGRAVDPKECRAGEKKLKQLAGLIEGIQ